MDGTARGTNVGLAMVAALTLAAAADAQEPDKDGVRMPLVEFQENPFPSTYEPLPSTPTLITNVTVLDGRGGRIDESDIRGSGPPPRIAASQ